MNIEIKIPSPGESITEVELSAWLVKENEYVFTDQDIAEIESEKATLTLSATESGTITFVAKEGDTIDVGSVACTIDTSATKPDNIKEPSVNQKAKTIEAKPELKKEIVPQSSSSESSEVKVTPLAKKIMTEQDLSIEDILNGLKRIGKRDVEIASGNLQNYSTKQDPTTRDVEREKISLLRKNLSKRLVAVKNETAMLTTFNEVDMTNIMNLRKNYQAKFVEKYGIKLGFMSLFTKAVTLALKDHPRVNSYIDGNELITPNYVDIGIAVQTKKGLMVPVVRDTDKLSIAKIEKEIKRLADAGRNNKITIQELQGGTFSITNGGIFGSMLSTPILNPPQSGILGMHNIIDRPIAVNGKVEIRSMMYLALSYDHRVIDGKDSVGFLLKVKKYIENPDAMLIQQVDTNAALLGL